MSELPYKRRVREWKRREMDPNRPGSLANQGYAVTTFDSGPFHIRACRGRCALEIRFCFVYTTTEDILAVRNAPRPDRCRHEVWQISEDGRVVVKAKISTT
jgi:hypothetical protein